MKTKEISIRKGPAGKGKCLGTIVLPDHKKYSRKNKFRKNYGNEF